MSLNTRETRFVAEYCVDLNATQAALRAGYSKVYARSSRLMKRPEILAAIGAHQAPFLERAAVTTERVLQETARIAFADPRRLMHADGTLCTLRELDDDTAAAVASFYVDERPDGRRILKLRLHDKIAALILLARHLGLLRDRVEFTIGEDLVDDFERIRAETH